ncbi:hypothetical protein EDB19DRAFT_1904594 [Suillus lakei]|nr:hypothetical protein EDB19DRAFT_1904594 [Suillus lakei]
MPVLHDPPASSSNTQTSGNEYQPLTLSLADIAATMSMAASCIRASITQYQTKAANTNYPSWAWIMHFKAGLQWEITMFVTPILQYSAARHIISVIPSLVAHILQLFPQLTWHMVLDHIFSSHLCQFHDVADLGDPSWIVSSYDTTWWIRHTAIPNELWQWDWVITCCVFHYQHWLSGIEDKGLILPDQVADTSVPSLLALRWMKECLRTLIEEQQEGIHEKMAEINVSLPSAFSPRLAKAHNPAQYCSGCITLSAAVAMAAGLAMALRMFSEEGPFNDADTSRSV